MQDSYGKGRPHGGTCWLISPYIIIIHNELYNECINLIKTNTTI
jgi:UDP-N-acetyl-D-mannosaminuronate dehydrogenase